MIVVLIALILLIFVSNYFLVSIFLQKNGKKNISSSSPPRVSVIIALKNEETNLDLLLYSLKSQNYPTYLFEIIAVDDNSSDNTFNLLCRFQEEIKNLKVMKSKTFQELSGKKAALTTGIECAEGEVILLTDGDCAPEVNWITAMVNTLSFTDGLTFGNAPFFMTKELNFVNRLSCFEQIKTFLLTSALAQIGTAYSATGRSLAIRKKTLLELGIYSSDYNLFSGDDDLLVAKCINSGLSVVPCYDSDALVLSSSKMNLQDYLNQKTRHLSTTPLFTLKSKIYLLFYHLINLTPLLLFPLVFWSKYFILIFLFKIIVDFTTVVLVEKSYGYRFNLIEKLTIPIVYELFIIVNFFYSKVTTYSWK